MKDILRIISYSIKDLGDEIIDMINLVKKPKTWFYITFALCVYSLYIQDFKLFYYFIGPLFLIYIYRQKIDGSYRRYTFEKHLLKNKDTDLVKHYYETYLKEMVVISKTPLPFEEWKKEKIKKIKNNTI